MPTACFSPFTTQSLLLRTSLPKPEPAENSQVSQAEEHTRASGLGSRARKQYLAGGCFPSPEESAHASLSAAAEPRAGCGSPLGPIQGPGQTYNRSVSSSPHVTSTRLWFAHHISGFKPRRLLNVTQPASEIPSTCLWPPHVLGGPDPSTDTWLTSGTAPVVPTQTPRGPQGSPCHQAASGWETSAFGGNAEGKFKYNVENGGNSRKPGLSRSPTPRKVTK